MKEYYTRKGKETIGPLDEEDLKLMRITRETLLWDPDKNAMIKAGEIPELSELLISIDFNTPQTEGDIAINTKSKYSSNQKSESRNNLIIWPLIFAISLFSVYILYNSYLKKQQWFINSVFSSKASNLPESNKSNSTSENLPNTHSKNLPIPISNVSASSYLNITSARTFNPENVIDDKLDTWWSPETNLKANSWLKLTFQGIYTITSIDIVSGSHDLNSINYGNLWRKNDRVTQLEIEFSSGSKQIVDLTDEDIIQNIELKHITSNFIVIKPIKWNKGSIWDDICISLFKPNGYVYFDHIENKGKNKK